jgi:hypothetical protein
MIYLIDSTAKKHLVTSWGTRKRSWLKHYATSRKAVGSIPDEVIEFFNWPNPSSRTMVLRSAQTLTKWVPGIFLGCKGGRRIRLTTLSPSVSWLLEDVGTLRSTAPWASMVCYRDSFTFPFLSSGYFTCLFVEEWFLNQLHALRIS